MSRLNRTFKLAMLFLILLVPQGWVANFSYASGSHGGEHHQEESKGPHGGRLLEQGDLVVELALVERSGKAEFRAWIQEDGKALDNAELTLTLVRLGGESQHIALYRDANIDYWRSQEHLAEPHSFDIELSLIHKRGRAKWQFESHEGRVKIDESTAEKAGIKTAIAAPGVIQERITLYGKTTIDHRSLSHVRARYPGTVVTIEKALGDSIQKGEKLATIESNDSLQTYSLIAPISGQIIDKQASRGEFSGDRVLFTIANYKQIWAELQVFPTRRGQIARGQKVSITADGLSFDSTIVSLAPGGNGTPFAIARAMIENPEEIWTTDLMVQADVVTNESPAPLVVENQALQPFRNWTVVFVKVGDAYEIRPLELGRTDGRVTEVLSGLNSGDRYVTENSYLIKADIEKSGAAHHH
ncbi:efflux RND transporter periplasmic adaptor subunit [Microbulbifer sp. EKSA008]|uniref:efflux RND transporter periplasmic adaptor subunit n=1 Tax=unclassified Microbulbifer TaxID=2619833 RepID=UPI0040394E41